MPFTEKDRQKRAQKEWAAERYKNDPEYRKRLKEATTRIRQRNQKIFDDWKEQGCKYCGETSLCCLQAHHRDPDAKEGGVSRMVTDKKSVQKIQAELDKCDCVCANCHFKIHAGEIHQGVVG